MTVSQMKGAKGKADRLFSLIVRARAGGRCARCLEVKSNVVCAHIIRRNHNWTRTEFDNAAPLCGQCHYMVDNYPDVMMGLVRATIGLDRYLELVVQSQKREKFDWTAEAARLDAIWKQMKAAA